MNPNVKIGNRDFELIISELPLLLEGEEVTGMIDFNKGAILISGHGYTRDTQDETWWHEVVHGIIRNKEIACEDEEMVCRRFAMALHALMKDNPYPLPGQNNAPCER